MKAGIERMLRTLQEARRCHLMRRIRNVQNGDKPNLQSRTARDAYHW